MTSRSWGRQYPPDGPLEPPPDWPALTLEIPADPEMVPEHFYGEPPWTPVRWPEGADGSLRNILGGGTGPPLGPPLGPPYTHTLTGPRPVLARNGKPLYWPPVRLYTMADASEGLTSTHS